MEHKETGSVLKEWQKQEIISRADGSYIVIHNNYPYHVPPAGEFAALWTEVRDWAEIHPGQVTVEPAPPVPTPQEMKEERASRVREERNARLAASDYVLMPDYPVADGEREAAIRYRRNLRELPEQPGFPWDGGDGVPWPPRPW